ncbi:MAG: hypothetical protein LQ340_000116, partial [Diploschistes diacapsis]
VPTLVTHSSAILALFQLHYNGWHGYRVAGRMLYELLSQHDPRFFHLTSPAPFSCPSPNSTDATDPSAHDAVAAGASVICLDAPASLAHATKASWRARIARLRSQSATFFGYGATIPMPCTGYRVRPRWRYAAPVGAAPPRLANPILFVSQTLDPITPLGSAEDAAGLFEGSGLVEAQGVGHCSFGWPNVCAASEVRRYFRTGEVSRERVVCPPAVGPFETEAAVRERLAGFELGQEREVLEALVGVAGNWPPGLDMGGY